jgi:UDP-3-O-[3-hydroxymyristoyl] glucosamine N-acyltransferase
MKLVDLAQKTFSKIESGDPELEIEAAAGLDLAKAGEVTFLANPKYTPQIRETRASAIFLNENVGIDRDDIAVLRSKDSYVAYTRALRLFHPDPPITPSIHPKAVIDESARIASSVEIMANVVIGKNCEIGEDVKIFPNVTIYDGVRIGAGSVIHSGVSIRANCEIGENCIIHNNSTIGSDGFGYAKTEEKRWLKIPQVGRVVLEDEVEIGANTAIDCASVGETRIKRGVKIDKDSLICSQTGLAGSSVIGQRVILAGQVGIAGHLRVGDDVVITAKSATSHDVEPGKMISGIPAFDNRDWLRSTAAYRRLGEIARSVREMQKRLAELEK